MESEIAVFPIVWVYWAVSLTVVTYASSYIVRRFPEHGFAALTAFYTIYLGASQIIASRIVAFDLGVYSFFAPAAVFVYPFIAQAIDMVNETYGRGKAHLAILIAFITQVLLVVFIAMVNSLPPAPFFQFEEAWQSLFSLSIRITVASWVAFLICQNIDAYVFAWLKRKYETKILLRSTVSDILDLTLDSVIFVTLAFYGVMPIVPLIIGQIVSKNLIGILDNPWFIWYKRMTGKAEVEWSSITVTQQA
ncbi:MAG: queuosine precursor transporter [Candidatus Bathyarchaeia archaeon]